MNFEVSKSREDREINFNNGVENEANEEAAGVSATAGNQTCSFRRI